MKVLSTKGCGICFKVKTALSKKGIVFTDVTMEEPDGVRIIRESGLRSMPIIETDDGKFYAGTDAYKYVETL